MNINRVEVGKRLLAYRTELEMTQSFVCEKTDIVQNTLSLLESGRGGGFDSFLRLIHFYSQTFNVHNIFAERFTVLSKNTNDTIENVSAKIAISELDELQSVILDRFEVIKDAFKES